MPRPGCFARNIRRAGKRRMKGRVPMSLTAAASDVGIARTAVAPMVHIVERLAPGGIETLVLDIASFSIPPHVVMSLRGNRESLAERWPRLRELRVPIEGFNRSGFDPMLVGRLTR